jgi:hypothetical protein
MKGVIMTTAGEERYKAGVNELGKINIEYNHKFKAKVLELLGNECLVCGSSERLGFHNQDGHPVREDKEYNSSGYLRYLHYFRKTCVGAMVLMCDKCWRTLYPIGQKQ